MRRGSYDDFISVLQQMLVGHPRPILHVTLVDLGGSLSVAAKRCGWLEHPLREVLPACDVRDVEQAPGTAFVSPCNSVGLMDGGVDFTLSRVMFPGVEARVRSAFERFGERTADGRAFMPIGCAVTVKTQREGVTLVAAPAMWTTQDVRGTRNAYHATYAALAEAAEDPKVRRVVFPGMGTGRGMLAADEALRQMTLAHEDFAAGRGQRYTRNEIEAEQRQWPENAEFRGY